MEREVNIGVTSKNLRNCDFNCSREEWFKSLSESKAAHLRSIKPEPGPDYIGVGSLTYVKDELKDIRPNGRTADKVSQIIQTEISEITESTEIVLFELDQDE